MNALRRVVATLCVVATLLLGGCATEVMKLDPKWYPLEAIAADPLGMTPSDVVFTRFHTAYVLSLDDFNKNYPEGSLDRDGILTHERVHAGRETLLWMVRYSTDAKFRWREERMGYAAELTYYYDTVGYCPFNFDMQADFCAGPTYTVLGEPMVSKAEALAWLNATWASLAAGKRPVQ